MTLAHSSAEGGASIPTELVARLEVAEAGSRELDGAIWCAVNGYVFVLWDGAGCVFRNGISATVRHEPSARIDKVSTSLDAALALAERVLPGWMFAVAGPWTNTVVGRTFYCAEVVACTEESGLGYREVNELGNDGATPALALCIAILNATTAPEAGAVGTTEGREPKSPTTREGADR